MKVIAFDADDKLWVNEPYFQETEREFCRLLDCFSPASLISQELLKAQIENLPVYGYGIKGYVLSELLAHIGNKPISTVA